MCKVAGKIGIENKGLAHCYKQMCWKMCWDWFNQSFNAYLTVL